MHWNFRIVRRKYEIKVEDKSTTSYYYALHEAFYDKLGKVVAITTDPIDIGGDNISSLRYTWSKMALAFSAPILDFDKIPEEGHDSEDPLVKEPEKEDFVDMTEEIGEFKLTVEDKKEMYDADEKERIKQEKDHEKNFVGIKGVNKITEAVLKRVKKDERKRK